MADQIDLSAGLKPKSAPIDLSAGLVAKDSTHAPPTPPTPSQSPLITSGEGQYQMKGKDGKIQPVSYSHVLDSIKNGFNFVNRSGPQSLAKFAADHAADTENHTNEEMQKMSSLNPLKYLAAIGAGVTDVAQGIGGEALKTFTAFDRPANSELETRLQIAAETPAQNPLQAVSGGLEQVGELATAPETDAAKAVKAGKVVKTAVKMGEQGLRAAAEQGGQSYVKSGGNTEEAKRSAEVGGGVGAVVPLSGEALKALGNFGADVGRFFLKVGDVQTGTITRETEEANKAIAEKAAQIKEENAAKIAAADKAHEEKVAKAKAKYDEAVAGRKSAEDKTALKQQHSAEEAQLEHEHDVEKARLEHEQALADRQELEAKASVARRAQLETRGRLFTRLQTIRDAATNYFKKNYADIEEKVGDRSVPLTDLADAVDDAKGKFEGSSENLKVFNDITNKMRGVEKAEKASGLTKEDIEDLAPDELEAMHREGGAPQSVGFADLKGYYSELGRQLASPSVPGDVKQAIVALRDRIDDMQQGLANDAGVGTRYRLLRNQYRNYAKGFLDYQGPNQSGSPVALALKAADAHNATEDFPKMEPEEISRVKQILSGKPTDEATQFADGNIITPSGKKEPAWRYRSNTSKLLDNFLDANAKAESLGKKLNSAKPVGEFVPPEPKAVKTKEPKELKPIGEFVPPEKPPVKGLKKVPQPEVLTPDEVRRIKEKHLLNDSIVSHFGKYMAISGLVGGLFAFTGNDPKERIERGVGGVLAGAVTPYVAAKLIERPDVVAALSKVTRKDLDRLMKLPADQRAGVEDAIKKLATEAEEKGKLKTPSPWLRILGGTSAVQKTKPTPTETELGESEEDIQKDLEQMQGAAQ